jgi:hypothetical protein
MTDPTFDEVLGFIRNTYVYRDLADLLEGQFRPKVTIEVSFVVAQHLRNLLGHVKYNTMNQSGLVEVNNQINISNISFDPVSDIFDGTIDTKEKYRER